MCPWTPTWLGWRGCPLTGKTLGCSVMPSSMQDVRVFSKRPFLVVEAIGRDWLLPWIIFDQMPVTR